MSDLVRKPPPYLISVLNFLADDGNAADLIICLKKSSSFSSYEKLVKLDENFRKFVKIRVKKKARR